MSLLEEFTLIAYADDGSPLTDRMHLDNGLGGAILLELALAGRVDVAGRKLVVVDQQPLGDPILDAALTRIVTDGRDRTPKHWVAKFAKDTRHQVLDKLVTDGVLTRTEHRVLGLFGRTKYPAPHGVEPAAEADARQRMRAAILGSGAPDPRTAALCALIAATSLDRKVFADLDRRQVKGRLKEISEGAWAAAAVRKVIQDVQSAVTAAVIASSAAAGSSS